MQVSRPSVVQLLRFLTRQVFRICRAYAYACVNVARVLVLLSV